MAWASSPNARSPTRGDREPVRIVERDPREGPHQVTKPGKRGRILQTARSGPESLAFDDVGWKSPVGQAASPVGGDPLHEGCAPMRARSSSGSSSMSAAGGAALRNKS